MEVDPPKATGFTFNYGSATDTAFFVTIGLGFFGVVSFIFKALRWAFFGLKERYEYHKRRDYTVHSITNAVCESYNDQICGPLEPRNDSTRRNSDPNNMISVEIEPFIARPTVMIIDEMVHKAVKKAEKALKNNNRQDFVITMPPI